MALVYRASLPVTQMHVSPIPPRVRYQITDHVRARLQGKMMGRDKAKGTVIGRRTTDSVFFASLVSSR